MSFDYDVIILGSGPSGFSCAIQSSKLGKKAIIIESDPMNLGGAWINSGTVPSKALREAAQIIGKYAVEFGRDKRKPYEKFPMQELLRYKKQIQEYESDELARNLEKNEVETLRGRGKLISAHEVEITLNDGATKKISGEYVMISTGSRPSVPEHIHLDHKTVVDTVSLLNLDHVPRRLVIVGSGINAVEYATIFAALGSKVTILNEKNHFLSFLDKEVHDELDRILFDKGIIIYNAVEVKSIASNSLRNCNEVRFVVEGSKDLKVIETEQVLQLGIRRPNIENIGISDVGITLSDDGFIAVDDQYRTNIPSVFAGGDVIGFPGLASVSFSQGRIAANNMFGGSATKLNANIPYGIYSIPELSSIGMSEQDAEKAGIDYSVGRAFYKSLAKASISNNKDGLLKIIFDAKSLKILGIHVIGESACDLLHVGQTVMNLDGDLNYFVDHVFNYPTYAEAYRIAAFNGLNRVSQTGIKYRV